ncbi:MAG TPA: hypothetical protein VG692_02765 [Gemmatimonadales bacterium]|nr:hypothetical protein [Gemmatimonadales bacterium]
MRVERGGLGVEGDERRLPKPGRQRRQLLGVVDDDDRRGLGPRAPGLGTFRREDRPAIRGLGPEARHGERHVLRRGPGGPRLPEEVGELELGVELREGVVVGRVALPGGEIELDRHVAADGGELPGEPRLGGVLLEPLAVPLVLDLVRVGEDGLEVAVGGEELRRPLLANPLHAGDVVGGVTDHREVVHHVPRIHAQALLGVGAVDPDRVDGAGAAPARIEDRDAGADELVQVLVAGHDHRLPPAGRGVVGEGADGVVGLVAGHGDERDAEAGEELLDPLHPLVELLLLRLLHRLAVGLVGGVELLAPRVAGVVDPHDGVGLVLLGQLGEERHDPAGDRGVFPAGVPERPVAECVVRAEDQRVTVDEIEARQGQ